MRMEPRSLEDGMNPDLVHGGRLLYSGFAIMPLYVWQTWLWTYGSACRRACDRCG